MGRYPKATKTEATRIENMMRLGCSACATLSIPCPAHEVHHIVEGNKRLGHWYTIGLCRGHHRGYWSSQQEAIMRPEWMVSIADGRKAFTAVYPPERNLWLTVQLRLGLSTEWVPSKIMPRRLQVVS